LVAHQGLIVTFKNKFVSDCHTVSPSRFDYVLVCGGTDELCLQCSVQLVSRNSLLLVQCFGTYDTLEEAVRAHDIAVLLIHGPSAVTNEPLSNYLNPLTNELRADVEIPPKVLKAVRRVQAGSVKREGVKVKREGASAAKRKVEEGGGDTEGNLSGSGAFGGSFGLAKVKTEAGKSSDADDDAGLGDLACSRAASMAVTSPVPHACERADTACAAPAMCWNVRKRTRSCGRTSADPAEPVRRMLRPRRKSGN
jgi:hypothetical protein